MLSLPVHCLALGCTTIGQVEDDVRIAQQFQPMPAAQMARCGNRPSGLPDRGWKTGSATPRKRRRRRSIAME